MRKYLNDGVYSNSLKRRIIYIVQEESKKT